MKVYFLGAGASKSFYPKLPIARELTLDSLLDSATYHQEAASAIPVLQSFASARQLSAYERGRPIEEILEIFEGHLHEYRSFQFCLMKRLWVPDDSDTSLLKSWLGCVRENEDVLITTNYDTVLERGILKLTNSYDPRPPGQRGLIDYGVDRDLLTAEYQMLANGSAPRSILLLKLHGSISWNYCGKCRKGALDPTYRDQGTDALDKGTCQCGGELSPILVGPGNKRYEHPVISSVVDTAKTKLRQASEIVFAGFSMNSADERIRELLSSAHAAAHTKRVVIVDKKANELKARYQEIYGGAVIDIQEIEWTKYLAQRRGATARH